MTARKSTCPQCGLPVEVEVDHLNQFETAEDAAAAGPVIHSQCASAHARRPDHTRARVLIYEEPAGGPLSHD